jgi:hypothetical protein
VFVKEYYHEWSILQEDGCDKNGVSRRCKVSNGNDQKVGSYFVACLDYCHGLRVPWVIPLQAANVKHLCEVEKALSMREAWYYEDRGSRESLLKEAAQIRLVLNEIFGSSCWCKHCSGPWWKGVTRGLDCYNETDSICMLRLKLGCKRRRRRREECAQLNRF